MNKLNTFNNYYCPWKYPSNWLINIKTFFKGFKYSWQRITKGYCDKDIWNLDDTILEYLGQTLLSLSQVTHGYPGNEEFNTFEKWQKYLEDLAFNFKKINDEETYFPNPYEEEWSNQLTTTKDEKGYFTIRTNNKELDQKFLDAEKERIKNKEKLFKENWDNLGRVFFHLWD